MEDYRLVKKINEFKMGGIQKILNDVHSNIDILDITARELVKRIEPILKTSNVSEEEKASK